MENVVRLVHQGLGQAKAQHGGIEPVKTCPIIRGAEDQGIEQRPFISGIVTENELFRPLVQHQLFFS